MHRTESMFLAMYKWEFVLIYCIPYIGFRKNLLVDITKAFLGLPQHAKLSTVWKMMKHRLSLIRIFLHLDRIGDSFKIRGNTDGILSTFGEIQIRESLYLGIYHAANSLGVMGILHTPQIN